jgi:hypothetical protein
MSKTPKKYDELNAGQQEFLRELEKAGVTRDQALLVTNQLGELAAMRMKLGELAAMRMKLAVMSMSEDPTDQQVEAWEEIERKICTIANEQPGLKGAEFRYDPRGAMTAVQLTSGASNSITGAWEIPLADDALKALDANFWLKHASKEQEPFNRYLQARNPGLSIEEIIDQDAVQDRARSFDRGAGDLAERIGEFFEGLNTQEIDIQTLDAVVAAISAIPGIGDKLRGSLREQHLKQMQSTHRHLFSEWQRENRARLDSIAHEIPQDEEESDQDGGNRPQG